MPLLNFRVDDKTAKAIKAEAAKVRYRTLSDYLRELIEQDLKPKPHKPARQPMHSDD